MADLMFIGIDIGNTSTVLGIYKTNSIVPFELFRYETNREMTSRELYDVIESRIGDLLHGSIEDLDLFGMGFSSVVPELNNVYHSMGWDFLGISPFEINSDSILSIDINYDNPLELGIDRIVNTEAALHEYGSGCIVVDLGTAITFDVLNHNSIFDGGIISPGIGTAIKALSLSTSQLPEIKFSKPMNIIGRNTVDSLKSGFYYGWASMVEGLVDKIETNYEESFKLILTGGFSELLLSEIKKNRSVIYDPELTMKGIKIINDNNI